MPITRVLAGLVATLVLCSAAAAQIPMDNTSANDKDFIEYAGEVDLAEMQLGHLAGAKSSDPQIKKMGRMIEQEHSADLKALTAVANKIGGIAPNSLDAVHKDLVRKLSAAEGQSFDRQFATEIVSEHKKVVASFKQEAAHGFNKDLRAYAAKTVPVLEKHLEQAEHIQANDK